MFWRAFNFAFCVLFPGLCGWWFAGEQGALVGVVAGAATWFVLDLVRGARVLQWLRRGLVGIVPAGGVWGEVADRSRRAMRNREQEVEQAERRLQDFLSAIQASPNGVLLLDARGRIEWSNQTAAEHLGIDPQRDLQQHIGNLVRDPVFTAYAASGDFSDDVVIQSRQGTPSRSVRVSVRLHPYGEGRKLLLSRDVTALEQAETMRRDFVANVSHEIRTPLTVLTGFVETLQTLPLAEAERNHYLGLMAQQAQRMQTIVSDLLMLSRLEGSPLPGRAEWTPLATLMAQCEEEARGLMAVLGKSAQDLRFAPTPALEMAGSLAELHSAFGNLVSNAVRYTPASGRIDVRWEVLADGQGEFSVTDTGPGIASEHLPRLTERFYRVDRSRSRETGGTGLGLAIVKHVAQRHGAELRIESVPGTGSRFTIAVPASRLRRAAPSGSAHSRPATESPAG